MREALKSRQVFSLPVLLILGLPSAITLPLTERFSSGLELFQLFVISLTSLGFVLVLAYPARFVVSLSFYRWWMAPILSGGLGASRGTLAWLMTDVLGLAQQELANRALIAGSSWAVLLPLAGYFYYLFVQARAENSFLKNAVARAESQLDSLDQQRSFLAGARVSGLNRELAEQFVVLARKLNDSGSGPTAYRELANELRKLAREQVRPRSIDVYRQEVKPAEILREFLTTAPSTNIVAAGYIASAGLNNLRVDGLTLTFLAQVLSGVAIWITLKLAKTHWVMAHFTWAAAAATTALTLFFTGNADQMISQGISAAIWAQALTVVAGLIKLTLSRQRRLRFELQQALNSTELDISSLTLDLETKNIEIAKYLHAILQTRLMAYAMQLEQGGITSQQLQELTDLLENPMREFNPLESNLTEGLSLLVQQWAPLVEIRFHQNCKQADTSKDQATLQVVREAIANSVRHGLADSIEIEISESTDRTIVVSDNGIGPRTGPAGLGTTVFNQLCETWQLQRNSAGDTTFRATL